MYASNAERIEQGYGEIAEQVKIPGRKDPQNNLFDLVTRWLRDAKKGKWLLVLDNADDDVVLSIPQVSTSKVMSSGRAGQFKQPLSAYLPQSAHGTLLVTTRTRSVATKLVEPRDVIAVEPMAKTDAVTLLQKKLGAIDGDSDLEELASMLEYMPLALVQAAAYIQQKGARYRVQHYVGEFQRSDRRKTSLLDHEAGHLRRDPEAKNSIIITWQISFTYIRDHWPSSADLLALMSFFDRQGIPKEVLTIRIMEVGQDKKGENEEDNGQDIQEDSASEESRGDYFDRFEEDMDRLRNFSFVSAGVDDQTFEMHGLVQLATRKWLVMQGEDERWRGESCRKLNAVFPTGEHENWNWCEKLLPHAKAAERQQPADNVGVRGWGRILRNAGWYASAKGSYIEAERMCDKSVRVLRNVFGNDDVDTLRGMGTLASTYWNQGRWTEAEKLEVQVMETRTRVLGEEHPDTLTSMANLASTYWNQGRWTEAEKLEVRVMETSSRVLGEEHPDTLTSMANLASTYWNQGRWTEAEKLEVQVMETRTRVLGEEHPDTLTSMANLASTYRNQGRWIEAEKLGVQVMETRTRVLGEEHPSLLTSIANLASTYWNQGRWTEAEKLFVQAMETRTRVLGEEHPDTLTSMANLASTYRNQGRWTEAETLEVRVMETRKLVLGKEHPSTLTSMNNLVFTLQGQGRNGEAVALMSECVRLRNRILGAKHPDTLDSSGALAKWQGGE